MTHLLISKIRKGKIYNKQGYNERKTVRDRHEVS